MKKLLIGTLLLSISSLTTAQTPLTMERVNQAFAMLGDAQPILESMQENAAEEYDGSFADNEDSRCPNEKEERAAFAEFLRENNTYKSLDKIVRDYGFDSPEDWWTVSQRVSTALLADMQNEMMASIMPADMPDEMRQEISQEFEQAECASEADTRFFSAHREEIMTLIEKYAYVGAGMEDDEDY
jgi:hypothetical protein